VEQNRKFSSSKPISKNFQKLIGVIVRESSWRQVKIDLDCYVSVRKLELQRGE
jgi:hypothetical protein